ncbi:MAG: ABC transporter substrate-binding protein [Acetobacteraceae bacterium]|nr:ABC transporter substrate-binding protein [Acetobacteraceae bacterium]
MIKPAVSRRLCLLAVAVAAAAWPAHAEPDADEAAAFIKRAGQELGAILSGTAPLAEKRRQMRAFIDRVVDVEAVARFCLGRHWNEASPAELRDYVTEFHAVLVNNIVSRMGDYHKTELHVTYGAPEPRDDGVHVPTTVEQAGSPPAQVAWVVRLGPGGPHVVDVLAEGTSLRVTVRSDFNAYLAQHANAIDALVAALREQNARFATAP